MRSAIVVAACLLAGALAGTAQAGPGGSAQVYSWSMSTGHGRLGLEVIGITPELKHYFGSGQDGVLVAKVMTATPADRAGVQVGDVLTSVAGRAVDDASDVWAVLDGKKKGDRVAIEVVRGKRPVKLEATLDADAPPSMSSMGQLDPRGFMSQPPLSQGFDMNTWVQSFDQRLEELEQRLNRMDSRHGT
jgi:S1-C subfamily serine protease